MQFKFKNPTIEAIQYNKDEDIIGFCGKHLYFSCNSYSLKMKNGGRQLIKKGDYVIKNNINEFKVIPKIIFESLFERS